MKKDIDNIMKIIPTGSVEEAVQFMMDTKMISHTAARDAEIIYKLRENQKQVGTWRAKIRTSCQMGISDRTVYRVADRFEGV